MPEVIDKVLVEQPFTIRPREGQGFGPVDVLGAEQVNVRVSLNRRNDLAVLTVEFNRGDISGGTAAKEDFGQSETIMISAPVFGPEVTVFVTNRGHTPVDVQLVTVYAVR